MDVHSEIKKLLYEDACWALRHGTVAPTRCIVHQHALSPAQVNELMRPEFDPQSTIEPKYRCDRSVPLKFPATGFIVNTFWELGPSQTELFYDIRLDCGKMIHRMCAELVEPFEPMFLDFQI